MWTRASTFLIWALAAASIAFWGLRLFTAGNPPPPDVKVATAAGAPRGDLSRLLGADAPPEAPLEAPVAAPDPRFQLVGVVSPRSPGAAAEGLAVIVVDDKPARAYRIGAVIDGQTVLQSVNPRGASLGPKGGAAAVALDLPPPAAAATGQMPGFSVPAGVPRPVIPGATYPTGAYQPPPMPQAAQRPPGLAQPTPPPPQLPQLPQQIGPQSNLPGNARTVAPMIQPAPGQPQGFNRSGASLR